MLLLISLVALGVFQGSEGLTMNQAPSNTSAVIGGNATLTCTVSNKQGGETVKWYLTGNSNALALNDVPVNNDGHYIISGTYNLVIVNVSIDDEAQYTCEAGGSSYYGSLTAVDLPTNMTVYWTTGPSTDGTSNLTCYATPGHPPPSLSWYKNGVALDNSRAVYTGTADQNGYGAAISILPVSLTSGDEGAVFNCEASYTDLNNAMAANLTTTFNGSTQTAVSSLVLILAPLLLTWLAY